MPSSGSTSRRTFMNEYCGSAFSMAASAADRVERQWMPRIDNSLAHAERHDRRADLLGQRQDLGAGIDRASADPDHRRLCAIDQLGERGNLLRIGHRIVALAERIDWRHI